MYFAVENNDPAEFHACHKIAGRPGELLKNQFRYLVAQAHLRRAAIAAYGREATATLKGVRGGIIFFDTSYFPQATIEVDGDTASASWTERTSPRQTGTYTLLLKRIDGRWFLVPAMDRDPYDADWYDVNIRFVQVATLRMRVVVEDVRSGALKADELDERVEKELESSGR